MWKNAFSIFNPWIFFDHSLYALGLNEHEFNILLFSLLIMLIVSMIEHDHALKTGITEPEKMTGTREFLSRQGFIFRLLLFTVMFIMIITWGYYGSEYNASDFIYGRF